jgi:glycosyltransferase involved in cell wall biosynthesis
MIIGIDGSEANEVTKVGSSEYAYQLLSALYRISYPNRESTTFRIFIKQDSLNGLPEENEYWKYEIIPSSSLWMIKKMIPRLVLDKKIDIFFSPTHYLPILTHIPQVCTIHDLGYLMFSEQFHRYDFWQLKYWTAISIIISKYIIAVSETTKNDIVRHYPFALNKIKTIYHGVDHQVFNRNIPPNLVRHVKNKFNIRKNYILSLGTLKPSKNIEGIIQSYSKLSVNNNNFRDYQLVVAGKKGWLYEKIFQLVKDNNLENKVVFTDYINEEEKRALYKGARLLLSPSFWEGFGMHVLESMACGTPVVISRDNSMGEIAGSVGVYVNPNNIDSISEGVQKVVRLNNSEYNKLSVKCCQQAEGFSWEKTAAETLGVLTKVLNHEIQ